MNKKLIKKIQSGTHAIENDGNTKRLLKVLRVCFPKDEYIPSLNHKYYTKNYDIFYSMSDYTNLPTIPVTDFFKPSLKQRVEKLESILVDRACEKEGAIQKVRDYAKELGLKAVIVFK